MNIKTSLEHKNCLCKMPTKRRKVHYYTKNVEFPAWYESKGKSKESYVNPNSMHSCKYYIELRGVSIYVKGPQDLKAKSNN